MFLETKEKKPYLKFNIPSSNYIDAYKLHLAPLSSKAG